MFLLLQHGSDYVPDLFGVVRTSGKFVEFQ